MYKAIHLPDSQLQIGPTSFHIGLLRWNQIHIMKTLMYLNLDLKLLSSIFSLDTPKPNLTWTW